MSIMFYHNPDCSKSRGVKALLDAQSIPVQIIEYLHTPFTKKSLQVLIDALNMPASTLIRTNNDEFRQINVDTNNLDNQQVIEILMQHPALFQRPVVLYQNRARIGRPPESVLEILS